MTRKNSCHKARSPRRHAILIHPLPFALSLHLVRPASCTIILPVCLPLTSSLAAPTSTVVDPSSPSISFHATTTSNSTTTRGRSTFHRPTSSRKASLAILTPPPGHFTHHRTRTITIAPTAIDERPRDERRSSQKPIVIVFEVLGGLIGLAVIISCLRCCYVYNKTPKRDRIAAVLHRHQLERELEELERNPLALRRSPTGDPVPPYFPPPPTYETVTSTNSTATPPQRSGYVEVSTASPPSTPPLPTRQLEGAPPASTIPRPPIPPTANG